MSRDNAFTPKSLTAPEYVRALFEPGDNAAILVRNRANRQDGSANRQGRGNRKP